MAELYFRISPEFRRCAWYVLASGVPLGLIFSWVSRFARDASVASAACHGGALFLLCMTMIVPLRWALRLDDQGIARRFLFRWDLWTWADISSGRIEKRHAYTLRDPERSWWRRSLDLGYMAPSDIRQTMEVINAYYRLPPPPEVPESVKIKYGNCFRHSARFDSKGVHLHGRREIREYLWREVGRGHITRMDPVRRDFASLEIVLPDREIELTLKTWRGATAEVLSETLKRHVPAERIDEDIVGERPARRIDAEKQLAKAVEQRRVLRRCLLVFGPLLVGTLIYMAVAESVLKAAFMAGYGAMLWVPFYFALERHSHARCLKLERQLTSFDTSE